MSLITRCPACGTMFKVVADQLKISQGWVRCGQCSEVFDAAAQLQQSASAAPSQPAPATESSIEPPSAAGQDEEALAPLSTWLIAPETTEQPVPPSPPRSTSTSTSTPYEAALSVPEIQVSMAPDLAAGVFASSMTPGATVLPDPDPAPDAVHGDSPPSGDSGALTHEDRTDVSFVRDARRQAFWRQPFMRRSLGGAALLLLLGLLLQVALFQRSALAARDPTLKAGLQTLCGYLRCEILPLRQIESIVIDSSSFNKIAPDAYRLKVVIKNTGGVALAMPSLELTLTDNQDHALLRRVLAPVELGADAAALQAGSEFSGTLALSISDSAPNANASVSEGSASKPPDPLRIAGYRVLAFYP